MLPLPSSCLRLEGIHYLPGYRQLSEAIFQLCAFKELIGGEIILSRQSRWRHNFIRLPWGLLVFPGDPTARVSLSPQPPPQQGLRTGSDSPRSPGPAWGSHQHHRTGGVLHCSKPGLGGCPSRVLAQASLHPIFPHIPTALSLPGSPGWHTAPCAESIPAAANPQTMPAAIRLPGNAGVGWLSPRPTSPRDSPALPLPGLRVLSR